MSHILMSVDNALQVDGSTISLLLQHRKNLWRVCRIDDDSVFGLLIDNKVGVIVTTTLPYSDCQTPTKSLSSIRIY